MTNSQGATHESWLVRCSPQAPGFSRSNQQKELDSLATSLLARQYPLEIITRNISKALLHSRETLLYRPAKTASLKRVLPSVTHTLQKEDTSPNQYGTVGISLKITQNCRTSGPTIPSWLTIRPNPSRSS